MSSNFRLQIMTWTRPTLILCVIRVLMLQWAEKLSVQREKMGILCIKKASDSVNLPRNVP